MAHQPNPNNWLYEPLREDVRKVFVGGLGKYITAIQLQEYFTQYGEIKNISIKTNVLTGASRGFAFVKFKNAKSVDDLLAAKNHFIANKKVEIKRAIKKVNPMHCKIFVTGLTHEMTKQDVCNHFVQFGSIIEYRQPFDKIKNRKKNFCFIMFDDSEVVNQVMENPEHVINGVGVRVRRFKCISQTMTAILARNDAMDDRAPVTFGIIPAYPGYMAPPAASAYGTAADYDYTANAYDACGACGGDDYSANGNGGGSYQGGQY